MCWFYVVFFNILKIHCSIFLFIIFSDCDCVFSNKMLLKKTFKMLNLAPWWLISKLAAWTLCIPFRTNSVKYQPIGTDLGALSAISVFQSLNKLSPLVADFKIGSMNSAYTLQDQLSQILAHLDWFGRPKFFFCHFSHKINSAPWWLNSKLAAFTLCIPFRTNSFIYQPVVTDLGALNAISMFQSQNKLGPLYSGRFQNP